LLTAVQPPAILTPMYPSQEPYVSIRTAQEPGAPSRQPRPRAPLSSAANPRRRHACTSSSTAPSPL